MKLAVFSDVHGNIDAFHAVKNAIAAERPDAHLFLGDLCGYYYSQNSVVSEMKSLKNLVAIRGNHDEIFLRLLKDEKEMPVYTKKYGSSYRRLKETLAPETKAFIEALPEKYEDPDGLWMACHGSPWSVLDEYIYPDADLSRFQDIPFRYVFLGHTHYSMHQRIGNVQIVNPGSCGQPRDEVRASFAMIDTELDKVVFHRVEYDRTTLAGQVKKFDPEMAYLGDVLFRSPKKGVKI